MMGMKVKLDVGAYEPVRAHPADAGLDIRCMERVLVPARSSSVIRTGVHVQIPEGCAGELLSKSGLNVRHDIFTTGLIDEGYDGEVLVKAYNLGDRPYTFEPGDKVSQLVVYQVGHPVVEVVDEIEGGERGDGGFGSTGR